jgi:DNA-binding NarL/FixJ family response regulator
MSILKTHALIIEDHPQIFDSLARIVNSITRVEIIHATTAEQAEREIENYNDKLALVIIDLGLPRNEEETRSTAGNGVALLRTLLSKYPTLNLAVNTGQDINTIGGLKSSIVEHQGGFTFTHKSASPEHTAEKLRFALSGNLDLRTIRAELGIFTMKEDWIEALQLAAEGEDNKQIAIKIRSKQDKNYEYNKNHDRTIDNYLKAAGMELGVYHEEPGNFRVRLINAARKVGMVA